MQAKRLGSASDGYDFGYQPKSSPSRPNPGLQIDLLLQSSQRSGLPALYALYNGPARQLRERDWFCSEVPFGVEPMGVSVLSATFASWLIAVGDTSQSAVAGLDWPLPCLLCPNSCSSRTDTWFWPWDSTAYQRELGFSSNTPTTDLALIAASNVLRTLLWPPGLQLLLYDLRGRALFQVALEAVRRGVRSEAPEYVNVALRDDPLPDDVDEESHLPSRVIIMRRDMEGG